MPRRQPKAKRNPKAGVTMLEMMVVLALIALVATLAAPRLVANFGRAKSTVAEVAMTNVKGALQFYYLDMGRYPSEAEGLIALIEAPQGADAWEGPYLPDLKSLNDPWGRQFIYRSPADTKPYEIITYGRDGHPGGTSEDKDITL